MFPVTVSNWDLWTLYHKVTFDGANRIIRVNDGVTELNIKTDIYSDWKEWVYAYDDNAVWLSAIRAIGGDPTVSGETAGDIYFLQNGWKLYIDLTKVRVSGVLFSDDFDSAYYDYNGNIQYPAQVSSLVSGISSTSGVTPEEVWNYSARTLTQQIASDAPTVEEISQAVWSYITRSLTEGAGTSPQEIWEYNNRTLTTDAAPSVAEIWSATSRTLTENPGPTAAEIADSVWDEAYADHDLDGTMGHLLNYSKQLQKSIWVNTEANANGDGSQENPYDNITSAIDRAEEDNIRTIYLIGNITLTRNFKNFYLIGIGVPEVDLNGQDVRNSHFTEVALKGSFVNGSNIVIRDSLLLNGAYLDGFIENSALGGNLICNPNSAVFMKDCASAIPGTNRPTISMNPAATSQLSVRGYNGGLTIFDCNQSTDRVTVELAAGSLTFASSCTNGIMVARGVGKFVDETNGAAVFNETINQEMLDTLEALATNINTNTDTVESSLAVINSTVNTINTNTDTVEAGIAALQTSIGGISGDTSGLSTQLTEIDLIVRNINNATTPLEPKIDLIYQDLGLLEADLSIVDSILDGVELTVDNTNSIVSTLNTGISSIETKVDTANATLSTINLNTDSVETSLSGISATVNTINTNVSDIETLSNTINTAVADIESLSTVINTNVNDIEALSIAINDTLNSGTFGDGAVTTIIDRIDTTSSAIETKVDTANATLAVINTNTDSLETNTATILGTVGTINSTVSNIQTTTGTINTNVNDIETLANTINSNVLSIDVSGLDSKVDAINTTVSTTDTKVDTLSTTLAVVNTNTALLEDKIDTATTTVNSINNTTNNIESTVNTINLNTDSLETSISSLTSTVNTISTNVTSIVGYTNNLQVTIEGVGLDTAENQNLLNTLQNSLNLVGADVTSIDGKVTTINSTTQSTNTEVLSKLLEVWRILGLDSSNPQTITDVSISVGDITLSISQPDASTTEVSRQ